jgi:hypothetical protein
MPLFLQLSGTALSKEALDKMGIGLKMLSKEEEEAKVSNLSLLWLYFNDSVS